MGNLFPIMSYPYFGALLMDGPRSRLTLLFVLLFLFNSISSSYAATSVLEGTVVKITDGDTITASTL